MVKSIIYFCLMAMVMLIGRPLSWATPPRDIKLSYDKEAQVLHIEAEHPSDRLERHYLRRLVIEQNGKEVKTVTFPRQVLARGLRTDVELPAKGDDFMHVELFCSQGGSGGADITLPSDPNEIKP